MFVFYIIALSIQILNLEHGFVFLVHVGNVILAGAGPGGGGA